MGIRIMGTGSYLPEKILTNADLEQMVETSDEWIRTRTGIESRHIAGAETSTGDMACRAGRNALEMAGIDASELDLIIVATVTPDHVFPSTGCILQRELGATKAFCFDLEAACTGLLYSLEVAKSLLKANSKYRRALIVGAEKLSSITNWQDRNTCVLFGDGASALVLENDPELAEDCILDIDLHSDGNYTEILKLPAGGSRMPASADTVAGKQHFIHMEGRDVFKLAVNAMVGASRKVLENAKITSGELRWVIAHQANLRIIDAVAQRLEVESERVYVNVNQCGNTSAASIGICLDELNRAGKLQRGDYLLLTAFGGGLTWGGALLKW